MDCLSVINVCCGTWRSIKESDIRYPLFLNQYMLLFAMLVVVITSTVRRLYGDKKN
jgi:hypothetical protein